VREEEKGKGKEKEKANTQNEILNSPNTIPQNGSS
jgi:hypothetical protein